LKPKEIETPLTLNIIARKLIAICFSIGPFENHQFYYRVHWRFAAPGGSRKAKKSICFEI
ncbi:MAG: hypothetical protein ACXWD4_15650, partial [Bacteroidia bacterium]